MRLQPPEKIYPEYMDYDQFKNYILNHRVLGLDKEITFLEFYNNVKSKYKDKLDCTIEIVTLFPFQYEFQILKIINELD